MAKGLDNAVAPKERINIVYQPATGGRKAQIELPLKVLIMSDLGGQKADKLSDRDVTDINAQSFDDVMSGMNVKLDYSVQNTFNGDGEIKVELEFNNKRDFNPSAVIDQVPELKRMMGLRDALKALRAPIGNSSEFRKLIDEKVAAES